MKLIVVSFTDCLAAQKWAGQRLLTPGFALKSRNENSGLFRTWYTKKAPTLTSLQGSTYEFDTKTRHWNYMQQPYCQ